MKWDYWWNAQSVEAGIRKELQIVVGTLDRARRMVRNVATPA